MKKIQSLICLLATLALCLSAMAAPVGAEGADLEPVTITMASWDVPVLCENSDEFTQEGGKYYDPRWVAAAEKFNVRFEYVPLEYNTHQEKLRVMINGDDMPDVMLSTLGVTEYRSYVEDGLLELLPEGYEENYPNIKDNLDMIKQRDAYKVDGQYYAIPRALESSEPYVDYMGSFYYRKDLAKAAGIEIKDYYTIDELFDMFTAVKAQNPDMLMFNHLWPDSMLQLGLYQAVPEITNTPFYYDEEKGEYVWAFGDERLVEGIKTFKKFYDAGFLDNEFFTKPAYESRNQFNTNILFSCFDGFDLLFYNQMRTSYLGVNAGADVDEIIGYAYLLDNDGAIQAREAGNSWSEYIFRHDVDEKVRDRFLMIYDWLLSEDGIRLCYFGREGVDYEIKDGEIVSLRQIDEITGKPVPFNVDGEHVSDLVHPLFPGAMEDSKLGSMKPEYPQIVKDVVHHYWDLRKGFEPLKVQKFDLELSMFQGDFYSKYSLKPVDAIYKIIFEQKADGVEAAWNAYLKSCEAQISNILKELNEGIHR